MIYKNLYIVLIVYVDCYVVVLVVLIRINNERCQKE